MNSIFRVPLWACDSHIHIYDDRFPKRAAGLDPPRHLGVSDYTKLQRLLHLKRVIVVTPGIYGTDNRVTLAAIRALGENNARGIAVVHPDVTDAELDLLHAGGIRGIRFTLFNPVTAVTTFDMIEPLAHRIQRLGWHVQLHLLVEQIVRHKSLLERLPGILVFDHMARLRGEADLAHGAFDIIASLIKRGSTWIKLSGAYLNSSDGDYSDTIALAQALIRLSPRTMLWGSDWPHPTERGREPDDVTLLNLLARWVPDETLRHQILVENPARLYGFQ